MRSKIVALVPLLAVTVACGTPPPPPAPPAPPVVVAPPPPPANIPPIPTAYAAPLFAKDQVMAAVIRNHKSKAKVFAEPKDGPKPVAEVDDGVEVSILALPDEEWALVEDLFDHKGYVRRGTLAAFPFRALIDPGFKGPQLLHEPKADSKVDEAIDINVVHMVDVMRYAKKAPYAHVFLDGGSKADGFLSTAALDLYAPKDTPWRKDARLIGDLPLVDYTPTTMDADGNPTTLRVEAHARQIRGAKLPYGSTIEVTKRGELTVAHLAASMAVGADTLPAGTTLDFATDCSWHVHLPADGTLGGKPVKWSESPCLDTSNEPDDETPGDGPKGAGPKGDGPRGDGPKGDGPKGDGHRADRPHKQK